MEDITGSARDPQHVFSLLGRKWTFDLLQAMRTPKRFNEFLNALPGLTNHVLAGELKLLEEEGLLVHEDDLYRRTQAAEQLLESARPLMRWAEDHGTQASSAA